MWQSNPLRILPGAEHLLDGRGDEPMTERQAVELRELARRTDEPFDASLTQVQAEKRIAALREILEG